MQKSSIVDVSVDCKYASKFIFIRLFIYWHYFKSIQSKIVPQFRWAFSGPLTDGGAKSPSPPLRKISHIYLTMMKLATVTTYLKKIQKVYESRDIPLAFHWHQQFSTEISKACYIKKYRYRLHFDIWFLILLNFLECLKIFLINMVTILTMSARMSTLAILRLE